jgi:indolepyruvate ferredoxin oxidoreductase beta subunit
MASTVIAPPVGGRISIAILALGGQGGGVFADWLLQVAGAHGYQTQGTSVPGVAQRTGTTVYYVELAPQASRGPVLMALSPVPGDVDIVVASELMEIGRALVRGFVSAGRTTVIGSTHRIFAISEKMAMGDGRANGERVLATVRTRAARFVGFDMDAAAAQSGCMISAVMLGALARSGALPFERPAFEAAIRQGGIAVAANLRGFAAGFEAAGAQAEPPPETAPSIPEPTTASGRLLAARLQAELAQPAWRHATLGVQRLMDYQDARYAGLYLDRLQRVARADSAAADWRLTTEAARHLALWMAYDDTIRVADLKTRASRFARVRQDLGIGADDVAGVTEFMHPRLQEFYETVPAGLGRFIRSSRLLTRLMTPLFRSGRHVETTSLGWFLALRTLALLRPMRPASLRYHEEQQRIERWLDAVIALAATDPAAALELVRCQRLLKGYSDTFERGLRNLTAILDRLPALSGRRDAAEVLRHAQDAALGDETGEQLAAVLVA